MPWRAAMAWKNSRCARVGPLLMAADTAAAAKQVAAMDAPMTLQGGGACRWDAI
jgi:hypothetical protein